MHRTAHRLLFLALLVIMASLAYGINYMYFSTSEMTPFGDRIRFWHLDTLNGPIRTNGQFSIMQNPVFFDLVIQSEFYIDQGAGYSPYFLSEFPPVLNAPELPFPETASVIRERAFAQGFYFNAGPGMQAWILILEDTLRLHWAQIDEPFDTLVFEDIGLPAEATVFIDASLRISGTVSTVLTIGAGGRIGLDDNIRYVSSSAEYPWPPTPGHTEKLALVSENQIKVLNTPANGRDNCGGPGPDSQPDINLKDIVISGILVAMNESFTFENQNDADSGYQGPYPDERGTVYLWGSLMHRQRNYVHRSNHGGSGYNKIYRYDEDLRHWDFGLFDTTYAENRLAPESIDFGTVLIGQQARDTVRLANDFIPLGLAEVSPGVAPFLYDHFVSCPQPSHPDSICLEWLKQIAVSFTPSEAGEFFDTLRFRLRYYDLWMEVPMHGIGITTATEDPFIPQPSSLSLAACPNPFNSRTTFSFALPTASNVKLTLFDVNGREVARIVDQAYAPGSYNVSFDAAALSSGVYFASLSTPSRTLTQKLLLIK